MQTADCGTRVIERLHQSRDPRLAWSQVGCAVGTNFLMLQLIVMTYTAIALRPCSFSTVACEPALCKDCWAIIKRLDNSSRYRDYMKFGCARGLATPSGRESGTRRHTGA